MKNVYIFCIRFVISSEIEKFNVKVYSHEESNAHNP